MLEPLVTVIVPVFNGSCYIVQALDSILAQTYSRVELLVIDDGSTDDTVARVHSVRDLRLRVLEQSHSGAGVARNMGVRQASGEFLSFLDADDLWSGDKLRIQIERMHRQPYADMVFGHMIEFVSPELATGELRESEPVPGYSSGTMLIRREAFDRVGNFPTQWQVGEFMDWYARAMDADLQSELMSQTVLRRRIHTRNVGVRERASRQVYAQVVSSIIQRRRQIRSGLE